MEEGVPERGKYHSVGLGWMEGEGGRTWKVPSHGLRGMDVDGR